MFLPGSEPDVTTLPDVTGRYGAIQGRLLGQTVYSSMACQYTS